MDSGLDGSGVDGATGGAGGAGGAVGFDPSKVFPGIGGPPPAGESVLMHHGNLGRTGAYVQPTLSKAAVMATFNQDAGFSATFSAAQAVYAQPLFVDGSAGGGTGPDLVLVATEQDNVYAFDATTGAQVWKANLGAPVPMSMLPCGNLGTYGVTGTPVIDLATRTLFVDAEVVSAADASVVQHQLFALSIDTGAVKSGWPIDVATVAQFGASTFNARYQSQRGALAVVQGTLYAAYGGLLATASRPRRARCTVAGWSPSRWRIPRRSLPGPPPGRAAGSGVPAASPRTERTSTSPRATPWVSPRTPGPAARRCCG